MMSFGKTRDPLGFLSKDYVGFSRASFFSDSFWEFLGKLLEPLKIYVAKFKFIAKGDLTSQIEKIEESLFGCSNVVTLLSCETKKEGRSNS